MADDRDEHKNPKNRAARIQKLRSDFEMIIKMDRIAGERTPDAVDAPRRPIVLDPNKRPEDTDS